MSESSLPDDLSAWPTDPYRLLGVERGAEPRAIRKAYHQLIRRFKPEHAPEAFRRIREAYEATQQFDLRQFLRDELGRAADSPAPVFEPVPEPVAPESEPADLWELACSGDVAAAYRGLVERVDRGARAEEAFLQLYWLRATTPDLDPSMAPSNWLARGLRVCGAAAVRLRELWKRAAEADPASVLLGPSASLLEAGMPVELVSFVADWRWRSARRRKQWAVIATDLGELERWLPAVAIATWVRLLLLAAENIAWAPGTVRDDRQGYRAEAERLAHDHALEIDEELSRFEYAEAVTDGLRQRGWAGISEDGLADLLRDFWDDRGSSCRASLLAFARKITRVPEAALVRLDGVYQVAPAVLGLFWEILGGHRGDWPDGPTAYAAEGFVAASHWTNYPQFRVKLLEFCLREMISPVAVARTIENRPEYVINGTLPLGLAIGGDWPLLAVYRTCEVSWE